MSLMQTSVYSMSLDENMKEQTPNLWTHQYDINDKELQFKTFKSCMEKYSSKWRMQNVNASKTVQCNKSR